MHGELLGGTNSEALVLSVLIFQKAGLTQNFVTGHVVGMGFSGAAAGVEVSLRVLVVLLRSSTHDWLHRERPE